jgi:hypothetical protein
MVTRTLSAVSMCDPARFIFGRKVRGKKKAEEYRKVLGSWLNWPAVRLILAIYYRPFLSAAIRAYSFA